MEINDIISESDFNMSDFLRSRKSSVVDVEDVRELLEMYVKELTGKTCRRKYSKTKVDRIESYLTPSGLKKLNDARKTIRMYLESCNKQSQREKSVPIFEKNPSTENYGFDDGPDEFIRKMHKWGEFPQEDRRYYLHMVFRYYFKEYHDYAAKAKLVIQYPSYQYILDALFPNGCANCFPPEFRRFLIDSSGRTISTVSLLVPLKGSSTSVSYSSNFESDPHVSTLRRKIQDIVVDWKRRGSSYTVYPKYLRYGDVNNSVIVERICYAKKVKCVKEGLHRLKNIDFSKLEEVSLENPEWLKTYDVYMCHVFKTPGEQLRERMGFFMRATYRKFFYKIKDTSLLDSIFSASGAGMEVFVSFDSFCSTKSKDSFLEKDSVCRSLLMVLVDICFLFHVYNNRYLGQEDPVEIIKKSVELVCS